MTLPVSGAISLGQVNTELGASATATRSLNDVTTRLLFKVPSGVISMSDGYGKSNTFSFTISSNQTNVNLRTLAVSAGWDLYAKVIATVSSGIYVSSNAVGTPALTINGDFPSGAELINNGFIIGMGGNGGAGGTVPTTSAAPAGLSGGLALSVSVPVSLNNVGTIGGGGGGGGGGGVLMDTDMVFGWAGGGGGGGRSSAALNTVGGAAGGNNYYQNSRNPQPGGAGTVSAAGGGGIGGAAPNANYYGGSGGSGGGWGTAGTTGQTAVGEAYPVYAGGSGGAGGAAISGNTNITYIAVGTRLGAIT